MPPLNSVTSEDWTGKTANPSCCCSKREPRATQLGVQGKDKSCSGKVASSHQETSMDLRQLLPQTPQGIFVTHFWAGFELMERNK